MPELIIPGGSQEMEKPSVTQEEELKYDATEEDEERFFLMYHMKFQPSEVEALDPNYRKWLIARFAAQKQMEQEVIERHRMMQQIGPNLKL